jgi:hypothetical protein
MSLPLPSLKLNFEKHSSTNTTNTSKNSNDNSARNSCVVNIIHPSPLRPITPARKKFKELPEEEAEEEELEEEIEEMDVKQPRKRFRKNQQTYIRIAHQHLNKFMRNSKIHFFHLHKTYF